MIESYAQTQAALPRLRLNAPEPGPTFSIVVPVHNEMAGLHELHRFLRGMVSWVGFKQIGVRYKRQPRFAGQTSFTVLKMARFALDAITSFSNFPLQLASYIYLDARGGGGPGFGQGNGSQSGVSSWVTSTCTVVQGFNTATRNQGAPDGTGVTTGNGQNGFGGFGGQMQEALYDCAAAG
jgi:hypothetical protein